MADYSCLELTFLLTHFSAAYSMCIYWFAVSYWLFIFSLSVSKCYIVTEVSGNLWSKVHGGSQAFVGFQGGAGSPCCVSVCERKHRLFSTGERVSWKARNGPRKLAGTSLPLPGGGEPPFVIGIWSPSLHEQARTHSSLLSGCCLNLWVQVQIDYRNNLYDFSDNVYFVFFPGKLLVWPIHLKEN